MPPLVSLCLGIVAGVGVAPFVAVSPSSSSLGALVALHLVLIGARLGANERVARFGLAGAGLLLGFARFGAMPPPLHVEGPVMVRGTVVQVAGREALVDTGSVALADGAEAARRGRIRVRVPEAGLSVGARLVARGEARGVDPTRLPGEPDPRLAAARQGVRSVLRAREVRVIGPEPGPRKVDGARHGGLLRAMLDGRREGIPEATVSRLRRTGTWHLVSISGLHVGLVAGFAAGVAAAALRPLRRWVGFKGPRWVAAVAAVGAAAAYAGVAGWPAPAVRAVWMVAVAAVLGVARRVPGAWESLGLAAAATLVGEPARLDDLGWQLSFASLAGVLALRGRLLRWLPPDLPRVARWGAEAVAATVGATLGTLPIVAWRFQDLAPLAAPANLWAVPWLAGIATPLVLAAEALPGLPGELALAFADAAAEVGLAGLAYFEIEPWHPAVGPLGAVALALALGLRRDLVALGAVGALVLGLRSAPAGQLEVWFLAVGQGDAALVRWPDGRDWLVDTGPPGVPLVRALRRVGVERLDRIVISHDHPDHTGGLAEVAAAFPVGVIQTGPAGLQEAPMGARLRRFVARGDPFEVLHPLGGWRSPRRDGVNDESLVLRVRFGRRSFLFLGDVERAGEAALVAGDARADVVKVAHHGSRTSSTKALVRAVGARLAVVSCGWENRYGHPHSEALAAWGGVPVYRTDLDGTVRVRTDGEDLRLERVDPPRDWPGESR